jgi:hypothetical protein
VVASSRRHGALCVDAAGSDGDGRALLWFSAGAGPPRLDRTVAYEGAGWLLSDVGQRVVWASPTREGVALDELPAGLDAVPMRGVVWHRISGIASFWTCERPYERRVAPSAPDPSVAEAPSDELATVVERLRGRRPTIPRSCWRLRST